MLYTLNYGKTIETVFLESICCPATGWKIYSGRFIPEIFFARANCQGLRHLMWRHKD